MLDVNVLAFGQMSVWRLEWFWSARSDRSFKELSSGKLSALQAYINAHLAKEKHGRVNLGGLYESMGRSDPRTGRLFCDFASADTAWRPERPVFRAHIRCVARAEATLAADDKRVVVVDKVFAIEHQHAIVRQDDLSKRSSMGHSASPA